MARNLYRIFCTPAQAAQLPADVQVEESHAGFVIASAEASVADLLRKKLPVEQLEAPAAPPELPAGMMMLGAGAEAAPAATTKDFRIYLKRPISARLLTAIQRAGGKVQETVGQFGVVAHLPSRDIQEKVKEILPDGAEMTAFLPDVQLSPTMLRMLPGVAPALESASPGPPRGATPVDVLGSVIATFYSASERDTAARSLRRAGIKDITPSGEDRLILHLGRADDPGEALRAVIKRSGLRRLEEKPLNRLLNGPARRVLGEGVLNGNPGPGLTGAGETVAVCDSGLDNGDIANIHPDFRGRVSYLRSLPITADLDPYLLNPGGDDGPDDRYSGHGTHVAGSVLGNGTRAAALEVAPVQGTAPGAALVFQAVEQTPKWKPEVLSQFLTQGITPPTSGLYGLPNDLTELFQDAFDQGARIHTNSWGSSRASDKTRYTGQCEDVDRFVWENKEFLILFAAGNEGQSDSTGKFVKPGSVTPPGTAKNCLTIGASENDRAGEFDDETYGGWWPDDFPRSDLKNDPMADSVNDLAGFSGRGPCETGRRKPDVVAPGTFVLSVRSSRVPANNFAWGAFPAAKDDYMFMGGTSMATPLAAGCAAVVRQHLRATAGIARPSAALMKAALIHSARYRKYRYAHPSAKEPADHEQGWGRIELRSVLAPEAATAVLFLDERTGLKTGDVKEFKIRITESRVLRVTMVYSDFPGKQLVNNLNLFVISPTGQMKVGNDFAGTNVPDNVNNVEGVVVKNAAAGEWTVRVVATLVPEPKQDFALVVSGAGATLI